MFAGQRTWCKQLESMKCVDNLICVPRDISIFDLFFSFLQIIVITHSYQDRKGVRYLTKGLKVYYLPIRTFYNQCILPTMMCNIPLLRYILLRERIQIVHGHSAFSALAHETMFVGKLLGLRVSELCIAIFNLNQTDFLWLFFGVFFF